MGRKVPARAVLTPHGFIATGLGSGLSPWLPGSVGSAAAVPFFLLIQGLPLWQYLAVVVVVYLVGWWASNRVCDEYGVKDPGAIVIDEFVGLWIALAACPLEWWLIGLGFVAFRAFDMIKAPWPIGWIDRNVSGGWGIMIDDVVAGLYAFVVVQGVAWFAGVSTLPG